MHPEILVQVLISFGLLGWFKSICDILLKKVDDTTTTAFKEKGKEC